MADVVSTLRGWSATASSNLPAGTTSIGTGLDDNLREIQAVIRKYLASAATNMASGATVDLSTADGYYINITGTTTITGLGTESAGISYLLKFAGALTLTHNATSLILPGGASITTAAGDLALMISEGSGNWRCASYTRGKVLESVVNVKNYGATGDGSTNDTTAIQTALSAIRTAGGGSLYFPPGTYIIDKSVRIGTKTRVFGAGASSIIKAHQSAYVGVNSGAYATMDCQLFQNWNYGVSSLTDADIVVEDLAFDWGTVTISGGGAHSISFRYVKRATVRGVYSKLGENVTAFLHCQDTLVENCDGLNVTNCFYDHWDGSSSASVINCVGRITSGTIAQGIQFTGTGSLAEDLSSTDALVMGCSLYGIRASGSSSAIIANANDAGSTSYRLRSIGNYVEDSDLGIVFQGAGGQHLSLGDIFYNVTKCVIFFNTDASGYPSNCRVLNPQLIDCNNLTANVAMISVGGTNNEVRGVTVTNSGAAAYEYIATIISGATSCRVEIETAPTGSLGRVNNASTTSYVRDEGVRAYYPKAVPTIASASTIAPTDRVTKISGTTTIQTITVPAGLKPGESIVLIPTGLWSTNASGNIALATTAVVSKALTLTYDPDAGVWFPSY